MIDLLKESVNTNNWNTECDIIYTENKISLRKYTPETTTQETPVFMFYSLANKPYVLDIHPNHSIIKKFLEHGFPVYLIDWGEPSRLDKSLSLYDYVLRFGHNCVKEALREEKVDTLNMFGYCHGAILALLYSAEHPTNVNSITTLAAPVDNADCWLDKRTEEIHSQDYFNNYEKNVSGHGVLHEIMLNARPFGLIEILTQVLDRNVTKKHRMNNLRRLQWQTDVINVAREAQKESVEKIFVENNNKKGEYILNGKKIDLDNIDAPILSVFGKYDNLVHPEKSKFETCSFVKDYDEIEIKTGHISLVVNEKYSDEWDSVCEWVSERE